MVTIPIPIPATLLEVLWFFLGITFGRAFGKKLDCEIQATDWFKKRTVITRWILRRLLDFTHHWWIGLLLVVYFPHITELYWFGWGLFYDDLPDVPRRMKAILKDLKVL